GLSKLNELGDAGAEACERWDQHPKPPAFADRERKCDRHAQECHAGKDLYDRFFPTDRAAATIDKLKRLRQGAAQRVRNIAEICSAVAAEFAGLGILGSAFGTKHNLTENGKCKVENPQPIIFRFPF